MAERENTISTIKVRKFDILRITTTFLDQDSRKNVELARVDYIGQHGDSIEIHLSYERNSDTPVTGGIKTEGEIVGGSISIPVVIEQSDWTIGRKSIMTEVVVRDSEIKKKKFGRDGLSRLNRLHG